MQLPEGEFVYNTIDSLPAEFESLQQFKEKAKDWARLQGFGLSIKRSKKSKIWLMCTKSGEYVPPDNASKRSSTQKTDCMFFLSAKKNKLDSRWRLDNYDIRHNHRMLDPHELISLPVLRRFTTEDVNEVDVLSKCGVEPSSIADKFIKEGRLVVNHDIYNAKKKIKKDLLEDKSPTEYLINRLQNGNYHSKYETDLGGRVTHLFFTHNDLISLAQTYNKVWLIDCTYKTNRYKHSLADIVSLDCFNRTVYLGFAFMKLETEEDYRWLLKSLLDVVKCKPDVIVCDRELALMNAIESDLPSVNIILCMWHINKNILSNCKQYFISENDDAWDSFMNEWSKVCSASSEVEYAEKWKNFSDIYSTQSLAIDYIEENWLPYRRHFVAFWTNQIRHFNQLVSSRVEGAHSKIKKKLKTSSGDYLTVCDRIENSYVSTVNAYRHRLSLQSTRKNRELSSDFFNLVVNRISEYALFKVMEQLKLVVVDGKCTGVFRMVWGMPCSHDLAALRRSGNHLAVELFDEQWHLQKKPKVQQISDKDLEVENLNCIFEQLKNLFVSWPQSRKEDLLKVLREHMRENIIKLPLIKVTCKGRPKNNQSIKRDPSKFEIVEKELKKTHVRCGNCCEVGHNRRTCKNPKKAVGLEQAVVADKPNSTQLKSVIDSTDSEFEDIIKSGCEMKRPMAEHDKSVLNGKLLNVCSLKSEPVGRIPPPSIDVEVGLQKLKLRCPGNCFGFK